jgi:hypothetical protein
MLCAHSLGRPYKIKEMSTLKGVLAGVATKIKNAQTHTYALTYTHNQTQLKSTQMLAASSRESKPNTQEHTRVHNHTCTHICTQQHAWTTKLHMFITAYSCACNPDTYAHTRTHTRTHTHMHTHAHTRTHIHPHMNDKGTHVFGCPLMRAKPTSPRQVW